MAAFDSLVQEIDERYCLGPKARLLVDETRRCITKLPGGARGYIEKCKAGGFSVEVASWLNGSDPIPLSGEEAERTLGTEAVSRVAAKVGASQCFARTVLGYAIPNVVALLAQSGAIPAAIRASASRLMRTVLRCESPLSKESTMRGRAPKHTRKTDWADAEPVLGGLIIPCVTMLMILGALLGYFIGAGDRDASPTPSQASAPTESAAPLTAEASGRPPHSSVHYAFAPVAGSGWALPGAPLPPLSGQNSLSQAGPQKLSEPKFPYIFFAPNRAAANSASRPIVSKVAQLIRQSPKGTVVEIAGYTDGAGRPSANMKLSQQRANAIRSELIRAGVDPGALVAKGYGVFPLPTQTSKNATFEGRSYGLAANPSLNGRRVEFRISQRIPAPASSPQ